VVKNPLASMSNAITAKGEPLLSVENLEVRYALGPDRVLTAVDKVSFQLYPGETLGLVGESGCGKSSLGRAILQLIRPASGKVSFLGQDLTQLTGAALRSMRRQMQIVFQDPRGSLNPRWSVGRIVEEPLRVHRLAERAERQRMARAMLDQVGLAASYFNQRPAQLSGGQQQRVGIARALVTRPKLVVCDEPVSSLDVSIQAQILNLLQELKESLGVAYLFVAHNLGVVRSLSDRVVVMYLGQFVETAPAAALFDRPLHPYTNGLIASVLRPDQSARAQLDAAASFAAGDIPGLLNAPPGCRYHTRCPYAQQRCREERPVLEYASSQGDGHRVACHFWREISRIAQGASL
jgi:oligopeptide/dipeptide ABC transporter ATP-binding protein